MRNRDGFVDITDVICPITFVKAKIVMEDLKSGEILEVKLNDGEPIQNVPRSFKDEGHKVIQVEKHEDGTFSVFIEKDGL